VYIFAFHDIFLYNSLIFVTQSAMQFCKVILVVRDLYGSSLFLIIFIIIMKTQNLKTLFVTPWVFWFLRYVRLKWLIIISLQLSVKKWYQGQAEEIKPL